MQRLRRQVRGLGPHPLPTGHHRRVARYTISYIWDKLFVGYVPENPQQELATRKRQRFEYSGICL